MIVFCMLHPYKTLGTYMQTLETQTHVYTGAHTHQCIQITRRLCNIYQAHRSRSRRRRRLQHARARLYNTR